MDPSSPAQGVRGATTMSPLQRLYCTMCVDTVRGGTTRPKPSRTLLTQVLPRWEATLLSTPSQQSASLCVDLSMMCCGNDGTAAVFDTLRKFTRSSSSCAGERRAEEEEGAAADQNCCHSSDGLRIDSISAPGNDVRETAVDALCDLLLSPNGQHVERVDLSANPFIAIHCAQKLLDTIDKMKHRRHHYDEDDVVIVVEGSEEAAPAPPLLALREIVLDGTNVPPHFRRRIEQSLKQTR